MRGLPLGVLGYTLVLAPVALRDVGEAQEAAEHFLAGARLGQLAVLPQPRHFGGRTAPGGGAGGVEKWPEMVRRQKWGKKEMDRGVKGRERGREEGERDGWEEGEIDSRMSFRVF